MDEKKSVPQINATVKKHSIARELLNYAIKEEIEPRSKELVHSMISGTLNMFNDAARKALDKQFYPDGDLPRRTVKSNGSVSDYVPHTKYSTTVLSRDGNKPPRESISTRSSVDINYIWVDTEDDAKTIINTLVEEIENYGKAKVATLYDMVKITPNFTDFKFGWTKDDIRSMSYYRDRGRYFIDLPKPTNIENV